MASGSYDQMAMNERQRPGWRTADASDLAVQPAMAADHAMAAEKHGLDQPVLMSHSPILEWSQAVVNVNVKSRVEISKPPDTHGAGENCEQRTQEKAV